MRERSLLQNTTMLAEMITLQYLKPEDIALDGTCGNGNDTLWLAKNCRHVYAFDIQEKAVLRAKTLLDESGLKNADIILDSHINFSNYIKEPIGAAVFNLGYLPGGNKDCATERLVTVSTIDKVLKALRNGGLLTVTMYWGHEEGKDERKGVLEWARALPKDSYHCIHTDMINQPNCPPEILFVVKKKSEK